MVEQFFDEVNRINYWADRDPNIREYVENGIARIDFVHMTLVPWPAHSTRDRLIIARADKLLKGGVNVIEVNLYDQLDGIHGNRIIVGGGLEDECVVTRAKFLQQQGAGQVIIDLALTTSI